MDKVKINTERLYEIGYVRSLLVVLLVFYHAFIIFGHGWDPIPDVKEIRLYTWLDRLAYSVMLETYTLISGYVWAFSLKNKGDISFVKLLKSKSKRLLLPTILFGIPYFILFEDYQSWYLAIYSIVIGVGHLWYLPMLFLCFVIIWLIRKTSYSRWLVFLLLMTFSLFSSKPMPLHFNFVLQYVPFFYLGTIIFDYRDKLKTIPFGLLLVLSLAFVLCFIIYYLIKDGYLISCNQMILGAGKFATYEFYKIVGTLLLLTIFIKLVQRTNVFIDTMGNMSFGVYIFQQFILMILYYHTSLPSSVSNYVLPWIGFCVSLVLSIIITYCIKLTKIGNKLI